MQLVYRYCLAISKLGGGLNAANRVAVEDLLANHLKSLRRKRGAMAWAFFPARRGFLGMGTGVPGFWGRGRRCWGRGPGDTGDGDDGVGGTCHLTLCSTGRVKVKTPTDDDSSYRVPVTPI